MRRVRLFLATIIFLAVVTSEAHAQDDSKWLFNIGGGVGFPQGDLSSFVNNGGHFVVGGGYKSAEEAGTTGRVRPQRQVLGSSAILTGPGGLVARLAASTS